MGSTLVGREGKGRVQLCRGQPAGSSRVSLSPEAGTQRRSGQVPRPGSRCPDCLLAQARIPTTRHCAPTTLELVQRLKCGP